MDLLVFIDSGAYKQHKTRQCRTRSPMRRRHVGNILIQASRLHWSQHRMSPIQTLLGSALQGVVYRVNFLVTTPQGSEFVTRTANSCLQIWTPQCRMHRDDRSTCCKASCQPHNCPCPKHHVQCQYCDRCGDHPLHESSDPPWSTLASASRQRLPEAGGWSCGWCCEATWQSPR